MRLTFIALAVACVVAVAVPRAEAGRGANLVRYLPDDSTLIVGADVARVRKSPVFKKVFETARQKIDELDKLASTHPVDKLVDTLVLGGNSDTKKFVAVLEGRVDKLFAEAKKSATKSDTHGGITYWTTTDGEVALIEKRLVFASAGDMPSVIDRAKNKKAKGPAQLRTMLAATAPTSGVFGGVMLDATARKDAARELGGEPQWAAFSFSMASKLSIDARMKFADEASAQKAAKSINDKLGAPGSDATVRGQIEGFIGKDFSESIEVNADHTFLRVTAALTAEEIDKVVTTAKMFM